jgi:hypothetical protein
MRWWISRGRDRNIGIGFLGIFSEAVELVSMLKRGLLIRGVEIGGGTRW